MIQMLNCEGKAVAEWEALGKPQVYDAKVKFTDRATGQRRILVNANVIIGQQ